MIARLINIIARRWKGNPVFHLLLAFGYLLTLLFVNTLFDESKPTFSLIFLIISLSMVIGTTQYHYSQLSCRKGLMLNKLFGAAFWQQFAMLYLYVFTHLALAIILLIVLIDLSALGLISSGLIPTWGTIKEITTILLPCYLLLIGLQVLGILKMGMDTKHWKYLR